MQPYLTLQQHLSDWWLLSRLFLYAHRLTIRIPDYELAIQIRIVTWGDGICLAGYIFVDCFRTRLRQ